MPAAKRLKLDNRPAHPLGVLPSGNALIETHSSREELLGAYFSKLQDELIMAIVQELDAQNLCKLGQVCRAFYAFTSFDDLWKSLVHQSKKVPDRWYGSWKRTLLKLDFETKIETDLCSDFLYRPFQCSQIDYEEIIYLNSKRHAFNMPCISEAEFSHEKFLKTHSSPIKIKMQKKAADWTVPSLVKRFGDKVFRQEYMDWNLNVYHEYMQDNHDESPLYLFDCGQTVGSVLSKEYTAPCQAAFGEDLFGVLGSERPDHRWLILGPKRSGSSFHKDPNATSAWNTVLNGRKYWLMFPPDVLPPGIGISSTEEEVTSPVSVAEWFLSGFYKQALKVEGAVHGICGPQETMYVPSGWWHMVVNLDDDCLALTGNFVPACRLSQTLQFLRDKPEQVSGFCDNDMNVYDEFVGRLQASYPKELQKAQEKLESKWKKLTEEKQFSFGFF